MGRPAVQVGEQLPVGKMTSEAMRRANGQAGFAYSALTHDYHHRHREHGAVSSRADQAPIDLRDLLCPVSEIRDTGWKKSRNPPPLRPGTDHSAWRRESRVGPQDVPLEPLELLARLDSQILDHGLPGLPVRLQRLSRPVTAVQCAICRRLEQRRGCCGPVSS